jgi:hypothetical protein
VTARRAVRSGGADRHRAIGIAALVLPSGALGCAGGSPLLHPAQTLDTGVVRAAAGVSANVAVGSAADDLRTAREEAARAGSAVPGAPGTDPAYAKGALVAAAIAPGLAPFVAARVGVGNHIEGGVAYTGRGVRIDMRRSLDFEKVSLSAGVGVTGAFYGRDQSTPLPGVDLTALHGYGADVPLLVGWHSEGGLYQLWAGARGGFERDDIETLTSEPKDITIGTPPIRLAATRFFGGGLAGIATGFRHVHVAAEIAASYQSVTGDFNDTHVTASGLSITPAAALWWTF